MRRFLFAFFVQFWLIPPQNITAQTADNQRFVGLMLLNLDRSPDAYTSLIDGSINAGANLVQLTVYWDEVHPTPTATPNWQQPDQQIEQITRRGAKVAIRIMLSRRMDKIAGYWTDLERPQDFNFKPMEAIYGRTSFSLAATGAVQKAKDFVQEVCKRYENYQQQGKILFVSFVNTPIQELGHHTVNYPEGDWMTSNPREFFTIYDYCPIAAATFRNWLKQYYSSIEKLSYHWQAKQPNWENITVPHVWGFDNQIALFQQRPAKEMYAFSHFMLKNFITEMTNGIRSVNSSYKVVNEYGSVIDLMSSLRNTLAFKDLDLLADGTKINNDIRYDHKFMTDVIRSNRPNKWIMNEVFYDRVSTSAEYIKQFDECFENGSKIVVFVIPDITFLPATQGVLQTASNRWIPQPVRPVTPTLSMQYSVSQVLDSTANMVYNQWKKVAGTSRQPVNVVLNEDILGNGFWQKARENVTPIVKNSIYDKAAKARKNYSLKIPDDTFIDPDGTITKIEAINLPSWLKFDGSELSGTAPTAVGDYNIRLRATDDEKATVELTFKLSVVDLNQKPVLVKPFADQQVFLNQYVELNLSNYFNDPDGSIVRIQGRGLQPWMSLTTSNFAANSLVYGSFPITLRAYDEDSTWVEGSFVYRVLNQKPQVVSPPANKYVVQGKAFKYDISKTTIFRDPDGTIDKIKALNLPSWVTYQNSIFSGTAPAILGNYNIVLRAYDNGGDSTQTQFTIVVDTKGDTSQPPTIKRRLADTTIYLTNTIEYKQLDQLFADPNGYIDRVEVSNLPTWLNFKNNILSGTATEKGVFTITLTGVDDDENRVSISFKINVLAPKFTFMLMQAGAAGTRKELVQLNNNDVLKAANLPARINIRADSDLKPSKMILELTGPIRKNITLEKFPFTLFDDNVGFDPTVGTYKLNAILYIGESVVNQVVTSFKIIPEVPLADWVVFPNPVTEVLNVKLPTAVNPQKLHTKLVFMTGQEVDLQNKTNFVVADQTLQVSLGELKLATGNYFLRIYEDQSVIKIVKVLLIGQ